MEFSERMEQIDARLLEIRSLAETSDDVVELKAEADTLIEERKQMDEKIEARKQLLEKVAADSGKNIIEKSPEQRKEKTNMEYNVESMEYRNAFLKKIQGVQLTEEEQRAYDSSSVGGSIPTITATTFFDKMVKVAPMLDEITLLRVAGNVKFTAQGTRNAASKHTENADVTPAEDTVVAVELGGYEYMKLISISATASAMSVDAFENWLGEMLAEDIAVAIEDAIINGDGDGDPKGVEYARTWTTGSTGIAFTKAGTPTFDNVMDLIGLIPARYDGNAKFLTTKTFLYSYLAKIKDDQKQPILVKDMANGIQYSIMGYPVIISDKVAAKTCYFGDFKKVVGNLPLGPAIASNPNFRSASIDYRGLATFDCDIALADAFVKLFESAT